MHSLTHLMRTIARNKDLPAATRKKARDIKKELKPEKVVLQLFRLVKK